MDTAALSFLSPRALAARLNQPDAPCLGGEDGVDAPADTAEWRAAALPRMPKPSDAKDGNDMNGSAGFQA